MAIAAELDFGFSVPVISSNRKRGGRFGLSRLTNMFAAGAVALFTVDVGRQVHDFLTDDFTGGGVAVDTSLHHESAVSIAEQIRRALEFGISLAGRLSELFDAVEPGDAVVERHGAVFRIGQERQQGDRFVAQGVLKSKGLIAEFFRDAREDPLFVGVVGVGSERFAGVKGLAHELAGHVGVVGRAEGGGVAVMTVQLEILLVAFFANLPPHVSRVAVAIPFAVTDLSSHGGGLRLIAGAVHRVGRDTQGDQKEGDKKGKSAHKSFCLGRSSARWQIIENRCIVGQGARLGYQ